jgi:PAS domain S-box-containing protein
MEAHTDNIAEKYYHLIEQCNDGIFIFDHTTDIIEVNTRGCIMSGYTREEILERNMWDLTPPHLHPKGEEFFPLLKEGVPLLMEGQLLRKDGTVMFVELSTQAAPDGTFVCFSRDITERKLKERLQQELQKQLEEKTGVLRNIFERVSDAFVAVDNQWHYTYLNSKAEQLLNRPHQPTGYLIGKHVFSVIPNAEGSPFHKIAEEAMVTEEYRYIQHYDPDHDRWLENHIYPSAEGLSIFFRDITEAKKNELELREAEAKFRDLVEKSLVGVYIIQDGKIAYVNPKVEEINGYTREELIGKDISMLVCDEAEMKKVTDNIRSRLGGETNSVHYEIAGKKKDGTPFQVEVFGSRTQYNGKPAIIGTLIEITERQKAEEELRLSEQKYRLLFNGNPLPMWMLSKTDYSIIDVNNAAIRHYGYTKDEFLQMSIKDMRPPEDVPLFMEKFAERADMDNQGIWRHKKRDGTVIYVEIIGQDIMYQGQLIRLALAIDVTEKLAAEEKLKRSYQEIRALTTHLQHIREEERTHIAREIHDELGQQLTVLKMDISWLNKKLATSDEQIKEKLQDMLMLLDITVQSVRRISSELRPSLLDNLGLMAAMEWHLNEFAKRSDIKAEFFGEEKEVMLPEAKKTGLFRIFQESLTNVARYAHATTVSASLKLNGPRLILTICDDGQGFDVAAIGNKKTLGLLGMRERAVMIGGEFVINSYPGKGTTIIVKLPFNQNG